MSAWHRNNPEAYERGEEPWKLYEARQESGLEREAMRPCAHCGELTGSHWCSESCRRAEDGPSWDEEPPPEDED